MVNSVDQVCVPFVLLEELVSLTRELLERTHGIPELQSRIDAAITGCIDVLAIEPDEQFRQRMILTPEQVARLHGLAEQHGAPLVLDASGAAQRGPTVVDVYLAISAHDDSIGELSPTPSSGLVVDLNSRRPR